MLYHNKKCLILSAEDDTDDQLFMKDAFDELKLNCELRFFPNGKKLIEYVGEAFREIWDAGTACMVFLDLNMPQLNGKEALQHLRNHIHYYSLPIFILSTSTNEHEVEECYALGANAVMQKPGDFDSFKTMLSGIYRHWMPFLQMPMIENASFSSQCNLELT